MRRTAEAPRPHLEHEERLRAAGVSLIAGIDEAGRGPLAGPVVAAAVVLPASFAHRKLHDSKQLAPALREEIFAELTADPRMCWSWAAAEPAEIDRINILRATHEAMRRALAGLAQRADHALIDGLPVRPFPIAHTALVRGDGISLSIAAASVLAKVTRDRLMDAADAEFPNYGFARHRGYATREHLAMLQRHGPCPLHRRSFAPVAEQLAFSLAAGVNDSD